MRAKEDYGQGADTTPFDAVDYYAYHNVLTFPQFKPNAFHVSLTHQPQASSQSSVHSQERYMLSSTSFANTHTPKRPNATTPLTPVSMQCRKFSFIVHHALRTVHLPSLRSRQFTSNELIFFLMNSKLLKKIMLIMQDLNTETPSPRYDPDWKNLISGLVLFSDPAERRAFW